MMANNAASVAYRPFGVVAVIGPWNYPVFTPMGSIAYALAAGNAVVFKPSEHTPGIGEWLARSFLEAVGRPVLQVVTGYGETGGALCAAGVGKVAFTGSPATARRVMAACAETLTPVLMEAGGKDALIVDEDADLDAAADAAIWGAAANAGQTCAGVERVYVHERVYDDFLRELTDKAKDARRRAGRPARPDHDARRRSTSSGATSTTPSRAGAARSWADRNRSASATSSRPCWSTSPTTPRRSPRRPSARPSPSPRCATWTRRSPRPTPPPTGWARRSSARRGRWRSPSGSGPG